MKFTGTLLLLFTSLNLAFSQGYITVDGDPSDWEANDNGYDGTQLAVHGTGYFGNQWIYRGASGDQRTDLVSDEDNDIVEVRIGASGGYLYFLVRMQDIEDGGDSVHVSMSLDSDNNSSDLAMNWNGDDSSLTLGRAQLYGERNISIHDITSGLGTNIQIELFADNGSSWYAPPNGSTATINTTHETVEGRIPLVDLGISENSTINLSIATFVNGNNGYNNDSDTTKDIPGSNDAIDVVNPGVGTGNAWDRDLSDGDIDNGATINLALAMLPVEFIAFQATRNEDMVSLTFSTASETNNSHFLVERSADSRGWTPIGTLPGAGNSTQEKHYAFRDGQPLPGPNYYRIRQIDFDGRFSFSPVVKVHWRPSRPALAVFPNPGRGPLRIQGLAATDTPALLHLHNQQGQFLRTLSLTDGTFDTGDWPSGVYHLLLEVSGQPSEFLRVVVP